MSRTIVLVGLLALAACDQPLAPAPRPGPSAAPVTSRQADSVIKQDTTLAISGTIVDSCTDESIALSGSIHLVSTTRYVGSTATIHSRLHTQHVIGIGLITGTRYRFVESMKETETVLLVQGAAAGKVTIHERIISKADLPNSFTDIVFTFTTPPFTPTYEVRDIRCEE